MMTAECSVPSKRSNVNWLSVSVKKSVKWDTAYSIIQLFSYIIKTSQLGKKSDVMELVD